MASVCDCEMLPTFAVAGQSQYGKGARLYLELMDMKLPTGSWTDIAKEQTQMRAIKSRGELAGGRLRNHSNVHKSWVSRYVIILSC